MKLTDALRGEHAVFYGLFEHLEEAIRKTEDISDIRAVLSVVDRLLLAHAKVEDDLLFPRLEPRLGQMGPLAVMRAEHGQIDGLLDAARQEREVDALKSLMLQLLHLARSHFRKEESVLFEMAEHVLGTAALTEMGDRWAEVRNVIVRGSGGCMGLRGI